MKNKLLIIFLVFVSGLFSGCQLLKPQADSTRLFFIQLPQEENCITSVSQGALQLAIRQAPNYLSRSILITKISPNELKELPKYRWAVPVQDALLDVIREHIQRKFPKMAVYVLPKDTPQHIDRKIDLIIDNLLADETRDQVSCSGKWIYTDLQNGTENDTPFEFHVPYKRTSDRYEGIIAAIEQVVFELSVHVTDKLDLLFIHSENIATPEISSLSSDK